MINDISIITPRYVSDYIDCTAVWADSDTVEARACTLLHQSIILIF